MHTPHFHMPRMGWRSHAAAHPNEAPEHHHHDPAFRKLQRVEGGIDVFVIALVVLLALAMIYGLLTTTGHPAYFDRWPT